MELWRILSHCACASVDFPKVKTISAAPGSNSLSQKLFHSEGMFEGQESSTFWVNLGNSELILKYLNFRNSKN